MEESEEMEEGVRGVVTSALSRKSKLATASLSLSPYRTKKSPRPIILGLGCVDGHRRTAGPIAETFRVAEAIIKKNLISREIKKQSSQKNLKVILKQFF